MSISRPLCSPLIPGACARNTLGSNTKREDPAPSRAVRRDPWSSLPPCPKPGGCRAVCDSAVGLLCVHYNACGMDRIVSRSIPAMMLPWSRPSPGFSSGLPIAIATTKGGCPGFGSRQKKSRINERSCFFGKKSVPVIFSFCKERYRSAPTPAISTCLAREPRADHPREADIRMEPGNPGLSLERSLPKANLWLHG